MSKYIYEEKKFLAKLSITQFYYRPSFILLLLLIIFFLLNNSYAQHKKHFSEYLFETTFPIEDIAGRNFGTVFYLARPSDSSVYMITARHVLDSMYGDSVIVYLRKPNKSGSYEILPHVIVIRIGGQPRYNVHPNKNVDLGIMRML